MSGRSKAAAYIREGLRGAPLLGVVVDLMFGWLFDISWLVVSVKSSA